MVSGDFASSSTFVTSMSHPHTPRHQWTAPASERQLLSILLSQGPLAAIEYMNHWTPHRITAVFRLQDGFFVPIHLFDKQGALQTHDVGPVRFLGSFGELAMVHGSFITTDSSRDPRAADSPCRKLFRSYVGVPLLTNDRQTFGSICHADFEPRPAPDSAQLNFFRSAAQSIAGILDAKREPQS